MLKVEVIEKDGFLDGSIRREFGDVFTHENGQHFVDLGWCKDFKTGESGERIEGASKLKPDSVKQKNQ